MSRQFARSPAWVGAAVLLAAVIGGGGALAAWKGSALERSAHASDGMPEPSEAVTMAVAEPREHQPTTSAVGTVLALRSVTLRNELAGTVRQVRLTPASVKLFVSSPGLPSRFTLLSTWLLTTRRRDDT